MVCDLCGCKNMVAFTPYGDQSRRQRRLMHRALGPQSIPNYHPLIESETHSFIRRLLVDSSKWIAHTRRYAGGLTLYVMYGYEPAQMNDPHLTLAEECVDLLANKITGGGGLWPVDIIPALKRLPLWAPGSGFLHKAKVWKAKMEEFVDQPYDYLKSTIKAGTAVPSFCSTLLMEEEREREAEKAMDIDATKVDPAKEAERKKAAELLEFDLKWTANSMYSASMDTTITATMHFVLAMMQHPHVVAKAQAEIDRVVGHGRLPTFSDRKDLPYIEAIMSETLRWASPVPLGLPHRVMEDDVYNGMFIPKGTLIFGNNWAMTRDERIYPNAADFIPERFLEEVDEATSKRRDPRNYVFGFGRRKCPGSHLIESSLWLLMVTMLATLEMEKATDDFGKVIEPKVDFNNSVFRIPDAFDCDFRPRSEQVLSVVRQTESSA
ncbi:hypothetical protein HGRIS_014512 [Hohenbuehelia grisea]|uniref:Cytochrome P450 n=1 Tax=Hohenbuehelia grisea TaxID=104357 RepID=A0ABR3JTN3_9AGAR